MEPLIVVIQGQQFKLNNLGNLIASIFGKEYFNMSNIEKLKFRYQRAYAISKFHKDLPIVYTKEGTYGDDFKIIKKDYDFDKSFIIDDEYSYILSLCKINSFTLLEVKNSKIFIPMIDNKKIDKDKELVVVNAFADEILEDFYNI